MNETGESFGLKELEILSKGFKSFFEFTKQVEEFVENCPSCLLPMRYQAFTKGKLYRSFRVCSKCDRWKELKS